MASAQGSFPLVSSLGVSFGGLNFMATFPDDGLTDDVQIILLFLSRLVATMFVYCQRNFTKNIFLATIFAEPIDTGHYFNLVI